MSSTPLNNERIRFGHLAHPANVAEGRLVKPGQQPQVAEEHRILVRIDEFLNLVFDASHLGRGRIHNKDAVLNTVPITENELGQFGAPPVIRNVVSDKCSSSIVTHYRTVTPV